MVPTKTDLGNHFYHSLKLSSLLVLPMCTVHITACNEAGPRTGQVTFSAKAKAEEPKDLRKDSGVWENRLKSLSSDSDRRMRQGKLARVPFD